MRFKTKWNTFHTSGSHFFNCFLIVLKNDGTFCIISLYWRLETRKFVNRGVALNSLFARMPLLCFVFFSHIFTTVIVVDLDFHSTKRALRFCPRKHQDSRENKTNCLTIHTICIMYNTLLPQLQGHQNHLLESSSISLAVNFHQVKPWVAVFTELSSIFYYYFF